MRQDEVLTKALTKGEVLDKPIGRHSVGSGVFLTVSSGAKPGERKGRSWFYRCHVGGKAHDIGLGKVIDGVWFKEAMAKRDEYAGMKSRQLNPLAEKQKLVAAARAVKAAQKAPPGVTFKEAAEQYIGAHEHEWSNHKHRQQWTRSLEMHAFHAIGHLPVADIALDQVADCLRPIWTKKKETAARVRGRIETICAFAQVMKWRTAANPASFKPVTIALGKQRRKSQAHPALPYDRMAEFMADLRARDSRSARALELLILTAVRSNAVLEAAWDEFKIADDWRSGDWVIPKERMKGQADKKVSHRVPLPPAALALLRKVYERRTGAEVFGLSSASLEKMIDVMNEARAKAKLPIYADPDQDNRAIVPHGFRSTFRDWAGDCTDTDHETIEFALAHGISDKTEAAYRRSRSIEKRRKLMGTWAAHCA